VNLKEKNEVLITCEAIIYKARVLANSTTSHSNSLRPVQVVACSYYVEEQVLFVCLFVELVFNITAQQTLRRSFFLFSNINFKK